MLNEEIEKTLQDHAPRPSEDFAGRIDEQVITLIHTKKPESRISFRPRLRVLAAAAAVVLLLGGIALTAGRGWPDRLTQETSVAAQPMELVPGMTARAEEELRDICKAANGLVPLNVSAEDDGIRFTLISAAANETETWFVYSLQELEPVRNRVNEITYIRLNLIQNISENQYAEIYPLDYVSEEHRLIMCTHTSYSKTAAPAGREVSIGFTTIDNSWKTELDLAPYLRQYGGDARAAEDLPRLDPNKLYDGVFTESDYRALGIRVLDWTNPLDCSLAPDLALSGIGVIDGMLHVQLYHANNTWEPLEKGNINVLLDYIDEAIKDYNLENGILPMGASPLKWHGAGTLTEGEYWEEYILDVPEDGGRIPLEIYLVQEGAKGDWQVHIPLADFWIGKSSP